MTIPDDLGKDLDAFIERQAVPPALTAVVQRALRDLIEDRGRPGDLIGRVLRHREEIRSVAVARGVREIRLFGSVARGEEDSSSDLDFVVTAGPGATLFDLARLRSDLEATLDVPVDVVSLGGLQGRVRDEILAESIEL